MSTHGSYFMIKRALVGRRLGRSLGTSWRLTVENPVCFGLLIELCYWFKWSVLVTKNEMNSTFPVFATLLRTVIGRLY